MNVTTTGRGAERWVRAGLVGALLAYAVLALGLAGWWVSALAATLVAALLGAALPRARFAAYVFLSVVVIRGLTVGAWGAVAFGLGAILVLQTPPASRVWPRLPRPRRRASTSPRGCSRMGEP